MDPRSSMDPVGLARKFAATTSLAFALYPLTTTCFQLLPKRSSIQMSVLEPSNDPLAPKVKLHPTLSRSSDDGMFGLLHLMSSLSTIYYTDRVFFSGGGT